MGKKKKVRKKKETPDRLGEAIRLRSIDCEIDGRKLTLKKWTLRQGMRISAKVVKIIQVAMPTGNPKDLLQANVESLIAEHEEDFFEILRVSVRSNFETEEETAEWIEDLPTEEGMELFVHIGRLNLRPLILKLRSLGNVLGEELKKSPTGQP